MVGGAGHCEAGDVMLERLSNGDVVGAVGVRGPWPVVECIFGVLHVHAWRNAEYVGVGVVVESTVKPVGFAGDDVLAHEEDGTVQLIVIS